MGSAGSFVAALRDGSERGGINPKGLRDEDPEAPTVVAVLFLSSPYSPYSSHLFIKLGHLLDIGLFMRWQGKPLLVSAGLVQAYPHNSQVYKGFVIVFVIVLLFSLLCICNKLFGKAFNKYYQMIIFFNIFMMLIMHNVI